MRRTVRNGQFESRCNSDIKCCVIEMDVNLRCNNLSTQGNTARSFWLKLKVSAYWTKRNELTSVSNMIKALDSNYVCNMHYHLVQAKRKKAKKGGTFTAAGPLRQPMCAFF